MRSTDQIGDHEDERHAEEGDTCEGWHCDCEEEALEEHEWRYCGSCWDQRWEGLQDSWQSRRVEFQY